MNEIGTPSRPLIGVVEPNRSAAATLARVMAAASGGAKVVVSEGFEGLNTRLERAPDLLAWDEQKLVEGLDWKRRRAPAARLMCWTQDTTEVLLNAALREPTLDAVVGWPAFRSTPNLMEVAYATRRALGQGNGGAPLRDLLLWGASAAQWTPRTTGQLRAVCGAVGELVERLGLASRIGSRVSDAAHELLMNAMYDAPVANGRVLFAMDRTQDLTLAAAQAPTLTLACDGVHLGLQVTDPFGRLDRATVLKSVLRGVAAATTTGGAGPVDSAGGGAGLGLMRLYSTASTTFVDVTVAHQTRVTWLYDLTISGRDYRTLPNGLHIYQRTSLSERP